MEDIAAEAGAGKGTLYRYFRDKEELYLALLARASDQFRRRVEEVARGPDGPRRRLERLVAAILTFFDAHPHLLDLIQRAQVHRDEGKGFPWQGTREELLRVVRELFDEGAESGEFHVPDPEVSVLMLLGGVRSVIRFGEKPRPRNLARRIVANFLGETVTIPDHV